ncbi:hypothetical protein [Arsenophonus endosymbiont of Aleurodicus floccissimus]|uniref:hypothetical protein n=1 Tax=Arsenophonus endosymbiont of Aleurodicus floccissimus TaxID=2152761 RepID=UPI000E6AEDDA|nr:hypothetical protein [Arsenophonus endosymbiont of Aleurodicus floccissimus]
MKSLLKTSTIITILIGLNSISTIADVTSQRNPAPNPNNNEHLVNSVLQTGSNVVNNRTRLIDKIVNSGLSANQTTTESGLNLGHNTTQKGLKIAADITNKTLDMVGAAASGGLKSASDVLDKTTAFSAKVSLIKYGNNSHPQGLTVAINAIDARLNSPIKQ